MEKFYHQSYPTPHVIIVIIDFDQSGQQTQNFACSVFFQTSDSAVGEKSPKTPRRSFPVVPLSPRTDNVPQSSGSIQSGTKKTPSPPASEMSKNTNRKPTRRSSGSPKKNTAPDFLFSLSPSSFYKTSVTPRARKKVSDVQPTEMSATLGTPSTSLPDGPGLQSSSKSVRQVLFEKFCFLLDNKI